MLVLSALPLSCDLASREVSDWPQLSVLLPFCTGSTPGDLYRIHLETATPVSPIVAAGIYLVMKKKEYRPHISDHAAALELHSFARVHHQSHFKQKKGVPGIMQHNGEQKLQGHRW